ncbi:MAG TPA: enoyl-ACP reductase, partial [Chloroflexota bacterium]|nr:enoyl-ACP reductase [Chloroflexota bacterium]
MRRAACGADVVVNVLRNREAAEATAEAVRKHGVQAWT